MMQVSCILVQDLERTLVTKKRNSFLRVRQERESAGDSRVIKNPARFMPDILNINTKESCIIN